MNASAKKDLPAPDPLGIDSAMRRRYQTGPDTEAAEVYQTTSDATTSRSDEATAPRAHDVTPSQRRDVTKPRSSEAVKPRRRDAPPPRSEAPPVADSVALTVRFDPEAYEDLDDWIIALRRELGWRRLDKSLVVRTLLDVAQARADVRKALLQALVK